MERDPLKRFSNRVDDYVRYRPSYPEELIAYMDEKVGLNKKAIIADVGSGTGIFTAPLLEKAAMVFAVEPNRAMREAAEARFLGRDAFHSIDGTAEATGLAGGSVDLVTVAQAFHWFDRDKCRTEFKRVLKPTGKVALIWNARREEGIPFLTEYEALLRKYGTDYLKIRHQNLKAEGRIGEFFHLGFELKTFSNFQVLDFEGLKGRLLSTSLIPKEDAPVFSQMMLALRELFQRHARQGKVTMEYTTEIFYGML